MVAAGLSEAGVSSEAFDKVFDVGYLLYLAEHEGPEVLLGVVLHWSPWAVCVEACPEGWLDRG